MHTRIGDGLSTGGDAEKLGAGDTASLALGSGMAPFGILRLDVQGRCVAANAFWCQLAGLTAGEALGSDWSRVVHPADRSRLQVEWRRSVRAGTFLRCEHRYLRPDGSIVWIMAHASALTDDAGNVEGYLAYCVDVSRERQLQEELVRARINLEAKVRERTQKLLHMAQAVESIDDAIISTNPDGQIVSWNKGAQGIFGWTARQAIGRNITLIAPPELHEETRRLWARACCGERIDPLDTRSVTKSGGVIEITLALFPLRDAKARIIGVSTVLRDVTLKKRSETELRKVSWKLLEAQDGERRRLARELHDSTAQVVTALSMNIGTLARKGREMSAEAYAALVKDSQELADAAVSELRTTSYLLHPPQLEQHGLRRALEWFAEGFSQRSGISVALDFDDAVGRLGEAVELALFRIVQEGLANIHRHSGSPCARIRIAREPGSLRLEIADAGGGFAHAEGAPSGVGISGMRERLAQLGGLLAIATSPSGTTLTATFPLPPQP